MNGVQNSLCRRRGGGRGPPSAATLAQTRLPSCVGWVDKEYSPSEVQAHHHSNLSGLRLRPRCGSTDCFRYICVFLFTTNTRVLLINESHTQLVLHAGCLRTAAAAERCQNKSQRRACNRQHMQIIMFLSLARRPCVGCWTRRGSHMFCWTCLLLVARSVRI